MTGIASDSMHEGKTEQSRKKQNKSGRYSICESNTDRKSFYNCVVRNQFECLQYSMNTCNAGFSQKSE